MIKNARQTRLSLPTLVWIRKPGSCGEFISPIICQCLGPDKPRPPERPMSRVPIQKMQSYPCGASE